MTGNVWQWCEDRFSYEYYQTAPAVNPTGAAGGDTHVIRGGCWNNGTPSFFRCATRNSTYFAYRQESVGFRCVVVP